MERQERMAAKAMKAAGALAQMLRKQARKSQAKRSSFKDAIRPFWLSASEEADLVEEHYGEHSWRFKVVEFIQSHHVQMALIIML